MKPTERPFWQLGLAGAERDEVLAALDVRAAGELQDVERGDDLDREALSS